MISFDVIQILIDKLVFEKEEIILVLILYLLKILLEGEKAPAIVLSTQALSRLNSHLTSKNKKIRELAALCLGSISYNERGKEMTIKAGSIDPLCKMLHDDVSLVRTAATRALSSLAQLKSGKVRVSHYL